MRGKERERGEKKEKILVNKRERDRGEKKENNIVEREIEETRKRIITVD